MKNPVNFLVALLIAFALGVIFGAGGFAKIATDELKKLQKQRTQQVQTIDSLKTVNAALKDSVNLRHEVTTKEIIKYHEIKPVSNTVPYLDSMFRARFH